MSEESRFQTEMMRLMNIVVNKIGGLEDSVSSLDGKVSSLSDKVSNLEKEVAKNTQKLDVLTAQFGDVTSAVIEHKARITKLEGGVAELQSNIH